MQKEFFISSIVTADKAGYEFLCELYKDMHDVENEDIYINFEKCKKIEANLSAVLGAIFDKRTKEGCSVFINSPQYAGVRRILSRNKFLQAFDIQTTNEEPVSSINHQNNAYVFYILNSSEKLHIISDEIQKLDM